MDKNVENKGGLGNRIQQWAKNVSNKVGNSLTTGSYESLPLGQRFKFQLAELLFFKGIKKEMGLKKVSLSLYLAVHHIQTFKTHKHHLLLQAFSGGTMPLNATNNNPRLFRLSVGHEELDEVTKGYMKTFNIPVLTWFWFDEMLTVAIQRERLCEERAHNQVWFFFYNKL